MIRNIIYSVLQTVRYAGRSLLRSPLAAATIVITVGLGLGLVAAVYTILNSMVFDVDEVREPRELVGIDRQQSGIPEPAPFSPAEYERLLRETDLFVDAFASTGDTRAWIEGVRREGRLVTGNFFQVLGVSAAQGRAFSPVDDETGSPPVMVLSHRAWVQHYAADPAVLERSYRVNGTAFRIVGVMPERFRGLEMIAAPDFWAPLGQADLFREQQMRGGPGGNGGLNIVGRLRPAVAPEEGTARLNTWNLQRMAEVSSERPPSLVLTPRLGTVPRPADAMIVFLPLFFAFGLILMIGCANVANLLLARLIKRQREIGIRLAIGASRMRVVGQLLVENLLLAFIAAGLGFVLSRLVLNGIVYVLTVTFPPDIGYLRIDVPVADWRVLVFLLVAATLATVFFALAPALRATRLDVARSMHGEVIGDGRPGRARDVLVTLQVTGSVLLLICAAIFLRSAVSSALVDPGIRTADVLSVSVLDEDRRATVVDTIGSDPSVTSVAASWPGWLGGIAGAPAWGEGATGRSVISYQFVSPEMFDVLGLDVVRGRGFTGAERNPDESVAVVAQSVAAELWPGADPIGQVLRVEPDPTLVGIEAPPEGRRPESDDPMMRERTAVVVGIARDVPGILVAGTRIGGSGVYMPIDSGAAGTALVARVTGNTERARASLVDRLAAVDPNVAEVSSLQTLANANAFFLGTSFRFTLALGLLALLLTLSGLFSVLSYLVEQRTREIGVRMSLGASRGMIGGLVLKQSARPVGLGVLIGTLLTVALAVVLLSTPIAEQIAATVALFDPVAYAASLACIVAACAVAALVPALRASRVNPLAALRQD